MLMTMLNSTLEQRFQGGILGFVLGLSLQNNQGNPPVNFDLSTHPLWHQFSQGIATFPSVDRPLFLERSQPSSILKEIPWVLALWGDRSVLQNLWIQTENPSLLLLIQGLESLINPRENLSILQECSAIQTLWYQTQSLYCCEISLASGIEDLMSTDLSDYSAHLQDLKTIAIALGLTLRSRGNMRLSLTLAHQFNGDRFPWILPFLLPLTGLISGFAFPNTLSPSQITKRLTPEVLSIVHTTGDRLFKNWSGCGRITYDF